MATMTGFDKSTKFFSLDDMHNGSFGADDRIELGTLDHFPEAIALR